MFGQFVRSLDAYPKLNEDFRIKTFGGAIISIGSLLLITLLVLSELSLYLQVETVDHLLVDTSGTGTKLRINFDVTFPRIPCSLLSVDSMDTSGTQQLNVAHHIQKQPLDENGNFVGEHEVHPLGQTLTEQDLHRMKNETASATTEPKDANANANDANANDSSKQVATPNECGSCFGAELHSGQCCQTCEEVRELYRKRGWAMPPLNTIPQCSEEAKENDAWMSQLEHHEGCRIHGYLEVDRVAGNFHFAPGKSYSNAQMHVHDTNEFGMRWFDVSHRVNGLSFGDPYPGMINPLDGVEKTAPAHDERIDQQNAFFMFGQQQFVSSGIYLYYVKVVPTTYKFLDTPAVDTNQYSFTEHYRWTSARTGNMLPGVFFFYDLSPIVVVITEQRQSLMHFLTQLCAIVGGVLTVAGLLDRFLYSSMKHIEKKLQMNKLS